MITFWYHYRSFTSKLKPLKILTTIFLTVFLIGTASATDPTDGDGKTKSKTEVEKKKEGDKSVSVEGEDQEKEKKEVKPIVRLDIPMEEVSDSTDNLVNNYNFILYFIYKYKYDSRAESLRKFLH